MIEVQTSGRARTFSLRHGVQTGSGAYPASYPVGIESSSPELSQPGRETDYPPACSVKTKNAFTYIFTPV
jgi:hypothetical protein